LVSIKRLRDTIVDIIKPCLTKLILKSTWLLELFSSTYTYLANKTVGISLWRG
jgi:hypothetical protein